MLRSSSTGRLPSTKISTRRTRGLSAPDLHSISAWPLPVFAKMIAMLSP
jgi:hypothetical protein